MTPASTKHLSEEELNDALIGLGSSASEAHLARCPECRMKVQEFHVDVDMFNQASMAWIEAKPAKRVRATSRVPALHMSSTIAGWALAAMLLAVAVAPIRHHPGSNSLQTGAQAQDSDTQITEDNELMQEVNAAINPDEKRTVDQYHLLESQHLQVRVRPK